jgi:hypothetical protein
MRLRAANDRVTSPPRGGYLPAAAAASPFGAAAVALGSPRASTADSKFPTNQWNSVNKVAGRGGGGVQETGTSRHRSAATGC